MSTAMTTNRLGELEGIIERNAQALWETAEALALWETAEAFREIKSKRCGSESTTFTLNVEGIIERNAQALWETAEAFREIKSKKLYKETHSNWKEYLAERWGYSDDSRWPDRMIEALSVRSLITEKGASPPPKYVVTATELASAAPEDRAPIWEEAVKEAGGKEPSHRKVRQVRHRYYERQKKHNPLRLLKDEP